MKQFLRACAVTAALLGSAPSLAALITYEFAGSVIFAEEADRINGSFSGEPSHESELNATFRFDTAKAMVAEYVYRDSVTSTADNNFGGEPFFTADLQKSGGDVPVGPIPGNGTIYHAYTPPGEKQFFMWAYPFNAATTEYRTYEYYESGAIRTSTYRDVWAKVEGAGAGLEFTSVDGINILSAVAQTDLIYVTYLEELYRQFFDEVGTLVNETHIYREVTARATSITITGIPEPHEVAEPAAIGVISIGLFGLALRRRRPFHR